jgi:uracil-DNA glycosylase
MSAAVEPEWFKEPAADFLREQINIVEPRLVVALGTQAYSAIAFAFGISTPRGVFRKIVEDTAGIRLPTPFDCTLFGVYHCGSRITGMTRSRAEQRKDWTKIRDALAGKGRIQPVG